MMQLKTLIGMVDCGCTCNNASVVRVLASESCGKLVGRQSD